jgi:peptidoglycan-N-acetylglucosamine deacetylase
MRNVLSSLPRRALARVRKLALDGAGRTSLGMTTHVDTTDNVMALTFDDGPDPLWTPAVLDVLASHGARATFFVIGKHAEAHPQIMERARTEGHAFGNHSWDHPCFPLLTSTERIRQIEACGDVLGPYQVGRKLFRTPYLTQNLPTVFDLWHRGYSLIGASLDPEDWMDHAPELLASRLIDGAEPGAIALLHDHCAGRSREPTITALDRFLAHYRSEYRFVTVPELLCCGRVVRKMLLTRPSRTAIESHERKFGKAHA